MVLPPYRECLKLVSVAANGWPELDGWGTAQGVNLLHLPFRRFLNTIYARVVEGLSANESELMKFKTWLDVPLPGEEASDTVVADEMALFMQTAGAIEQGR